MIRDAKEQVSSGAELAQNAQRGRRFFGEVQGAYAWVILASCTQTLPYRTQIG
jgi:hypothetical protein